MRRVALFLVVLAAIGAAVWFFFLRGPAGQPPQLASQVGQANTLVFSAVEHPDALIQKLLSRAEKQSLPEPAKVALDPNARQGAIGFDPAQSTGWQSVGVDPARGVGLVLDSRTLDAKIGPQPYILLRLTDEAAFLKWLGERVGAPAKIEADQIVLSPRRRLAIARRGDLTLLSEGIPPALLKTIASTQGATLDGAPGFDAVFAGPSTPGRVVGFAATRNLKRIPPLAAPEIAPSVDFYADLFPAVGGMIDHDVMRLTLATSENGRKALQQIFAPRKRAPAFSKWIPAKGFGAVRISGNLREFFTGVQALMPPAVPAALRGQVGLAKLGLAAVGLDWSSVTEAFTGHAVIAFKPASKGPPEVIGLVALGNPSKADQLLDAVEKSAGRFMRQMGDSPIKKTTIEGLPARSVALGRQSIHVVRAGDMLVFASSAALAAETVKRGKSGANSLSGTSAAALLDGEVVLAFTMDLKSMLPPSAPAEMAKVFETMEPMEAAIRLEKHGLVADGKSMAVLTGVGLSAYLLTAKVEESQREAVEALERARAAEEAHRKRLEVMKKAAPEAPQ